VVQRSNVQNDPEYLREIVIAASESSSWKAIELPVSHQGRYKSDVGKTHEATLNAAVAAEEIALEAFCKDQTQFGNAERKMRFWVGSSVGFWVHGMQ